MDPSEAERQGIGAGSVMRRKADGGYEWLTDEVDDRRAAGNPDRRRIRSP